MTVVKRIRCDGTLTQRRRRRDLCTGREQLIDWNQQHTRDVSTHTHGRGSAQCCWWLFANNNTSTNLIALVMDIISTFVVLSCPCWFFEEKKNIKMWWCRWSPLFSSPPSYLALSWQQQTDRARPLLLDVGRKKAIVIPSISGDMIINTHT